MNICKNKIRRDLLKLGKNLVPFQTKRKKFIYLRREAIIIADEAKMRYFVQLFKNRLEKIIREANS